MYIVELYTFKRPDRGATVNKLTHHCYSPPEQVEVDECLVLY